jgi:O-acetyl-ADP-ribose deacetylase (regulator of RNase III)
MITYILGDATEPIGVGPRIIVHIVNSAGAWGRGFVLSVTRRWSAPEHAYRRWSKREDISARSRRGDSAFILGNVQLVDVGAGIIVANMLAQEGIRRGFDGRPPIRYEALGMCLRKVRTAAVARGASVHMPRIGTGLAGSSWERVEPIVSSTLRGINVTVYDL